MAKVVYIAGPITGTKDYRERFARAAALIEQMGYIALNPATLPGGLTNEQYMKICFSMIESADVVLFLSNWRKSLGASLEQLYCNYIGKPVALNYDDVDWMLQR